MYTARFALSRHVGLTAIAGRRHLAPLRREVGRWSINHGIAPRGRYRAIDRQIRSQSNIGKHILYIKLNWICDWESKGENEELIYHSNTFTTANPTT